MAVKENLGADSPENWGRQFGSGELLSKRQCPPPPPALPGGRDFPIGRSDKEFAPPILSISPQSTRASCHCCPGSWVGGGERVGLRDPELKSLSKEAEMIFDP